MSNQQFNQANNQKQYFNLHTSGVGYLNDIRCVQPKKGKPFYACRISALTGDSENPEYRYFDCSIPVGCEAEELIKRCVPALEQKAKVFLSFKLADLWIDEYVLQKDTKTKKKGDTAFSLKARLIKINSISINGKKRYSSFDEENSFNQDNSMAQTETVNADETF